MSLIDKFDQLNNTDLSALSARLAKLRAEMERDLEIQGKPAPAVITTNDLQAASAQAGLTPEQLLEALETAQRRGLI